MKSGGATAVTISSSLQWHPPPPFLSSITAGHSLRPTTIQSHRLGFNNYDVHHHDSSAKYWEKFYQRHENKFFRDRHYLEKDWGHYFSDEDEVSPNGKVVLEVGCGAGNTIFPIVTRYPKLFVHACDFSPHAITLVKSHTKFTEDKINAFVCNVAEDDLCDYVMPSSIDVVTLFLQRISFLWYRTSGKY